MPCSVPSRGVSVRLLTTLIVILALASAACGRSPERDVRRTLDDFATATAKKDYQRLCDEIFSEKLVEEVRKVVPCEVALQRSDLATAENPKLEIQSVKVKGDTATAVVSTTAKNQKPSKDTVKLVKEGEDWRIQSLAS
jgi:hypothetical protein